MNGPRTDLPAGKDDTTTYCYDRHDRVVKVIDAKGNKRSSKYDSNSNVIELAEAGVSESGTMTATFENDNLTQVSLPTGGQAYMSYDSAQNPHFPTGVHDFSTGGDSAAPTWQYEYDDDGNLIRALNESAPAKPVRFQYCYRADGNLTRIDQPPALTDASGAVVLDRNLDGDACAGLPQGNDTLLSYDAAGNLTKIDPPSAHGTVTFTYDGASRVKTTTDGRGNVSTFTYDAVDRVTRIDIVKPASGETPIQTAVAEEELIPPDSSDSTWVTYQYDLNGNLTTRKDNQGAESFVYDELNRMVKQTPQSPAASITYAYDAAFNLRTLQATDASGTKTIDYAYDEVNLITSLTDFESRTVTFEHNDRNLRTKIVYPGDVKNESVYDKSRRLLCTFSYKGTRPTSPPSQGTDEEKKCPSPSTAYISYSRYSYRDTVAGVDTDTNRRESFTGRDGVKVSYDYDGIGRLTKADAASGTDYSYEYDDRGNITKKTIAGSATTYAYDAANEICWSAPGSVTAPACSNAPSGATTYSFDAAGNLSTTSVGLSASYNSRNQMTSVTPPGGASVSMAYMDMSSDRRILAGDTRMAYSQGGLQSQGPNNGSPHGTWFVREPSGTLSQMLEVDAAKKDLYYHLDGLGSIIATTDAAGNVVRRYAYEPYGKELGTATEIHGDPNPWRYASGYYDKGTSWLKFGTRYYDPNLGRWTQRDPLMGTPGDPLSHNLYAYVVGDPINVVDPSGRHWVGVPCQLGDCDWDDSNDSPIELWLEENVIDAVGRWVTYVVNFGETLWQTAQRTGRDIVTFVRAVLCARGRICI